MAILPYIAANDERLPLCNGRPVWPISGTEDLAALRAIAALFGAKLQHVAADAWRVPDGASPELKGDREIVAFFRPELRPLAELYAHLTSRVAKLLDVARLDEPLLGVIVCLWSELSLHLLEEVHVSCTARPVGLVVAEGYDELRRRVLRSAAAAALDAPHDGAIVFAHGSATTPRLEDLSEQRPCTAVLLHLGHSDGLDLNFTKDEIICPLASATGRLRRISSRAPCAVSDYCYRLQLPLDSALRSSRLISPSALHARVAVFLTCFGAAASDSLVSPSWSLIEALLATPSIGCVAIPVGVAIPTTMDADAIYRSFEAGKTVGDALYRNPNLRREAHDRFRILIFGDPRTRPVGGRETGCSQEPRPEAQHVLPTALLRTMAPAWTLESRHYLLHDILSSAMKTHVGLGDRLLRYYEEAGHDPGSDDEFVKFLDGVAPLWDHWLAASALPVLCSHSTFCCGCGRPAQCFAVMWRETAVRMLSACVRCGLSQDTELDSQLEAHPPAIRDSVVEIPDSVEGAWVMVRHKDELKKSTRWVLAPSKGRRQPITALSQKVVTGAGLATVNVVYLRELEIATWQFAVNASAE